MVRSKPPKKSESLEIRIAHATKQAFMARCHAEGVSASEVIRTIIEHRLADGSARLDRPRGTRRKRWTVAAGAVLALSVGLTALPSFARTSLRGEFDRLDLNHDHRLELAELERSATVQVEVRLSGSPGLSSGGGHAMPVAYERDPEGAPAVQIAHRWLARQLAHMDLNGDGVVSFDEFRRYREGQGR